MADEQHNKRPHQHRQPHPHALQNQSALLCQNGHHRYHKVQFRYQLPILGEILATGPAGAGGGLLEHLHSDNKTNLSNEKHRDKQTPHNALLIGTNVQALLPPGINRGPLGSTEDHIGKIARPFDVLKYLT